MSAQIQGGSLALVVAVACGAAAPAWAHGTTERVSVGPGGVQANGASTDPAVSADGRFVAFESRATNLVAGDTNGSPDIFVRDRQRGTTRRVSLGPGGVQGDFNSFDPALSADGRFVAFYSFASNLVPGDTNGTADVFVRDRQTGTTQRVSLGPRGVEGNAGSAFVALSASGRFVAFGSDASNLVPGDTNNLFDMFVHDRQSGTTERVSVGPGGVQANGFSVGPTLSADGRFVAFDSSATNLGPGVDTNGRVDVFVRDRQSRTIERVSVSSDGAPGDALSFHSAISADGRFVTFNSIAANLVPGDTNGHFDVFVRNRRAGTTRRVNVGPGGAQSNAESFNPAVSASGRFVAFSSGATNLVPDDTNDLFKFDIFLRDRRTGTNRLVSTVPGRVQADGDSDFPAVSDDGRVVSFESDATNLVPGDTNGLRDVFVRVFAP